MSITGTLAPERGFHPTLELTFVPSRRPAGSCALLTAVSVPRSVILDRYQIAQLDRERALGSARGVSLLDVVGHLDLEVPEWSASAGPAAVLVQLVAPLQSLHDDDDDDDDVITVGIPLHMRYQRPTRTGRVEVGIERPTTFWACPRDVPFKLNPSTTPCPISALSSSSSEFSFPSLSQYSSVHYLNDDDPGVVDRSSPSLSCVRSSSGTEQQPPFVTIVVPTAVASDAEFVGPTTVVFIWIGFVYLAWTTWRTLAVGRGSSTALASASDK